MATPLAAGLVGLMISVNPSLTPNQIQNCITSSGVDINQNIGPRIDAYQAIICALPDVSSILFTFILLVINILCYLISNNNYS